MLLFESIAILVVVLISVSLVYYTLKLGISPIPTSTAVRSQLLSLAQEQVEMYPIKTIAELGSGWGTLAISLARKFPNTTVYAYEYSLIPYWYTKIRLWISPQDNLFLQRKNFYTLSMSDFDMIVCYLYPGAMKKLRSKFEQELFKPTSILTHTFSIHEWDASDMKHVHDLHQTKIYLYRIS